MNKKVPSKDDSTAMLFLTAGSLPSPSVDHMEAIPDDSFVSRLFVVEMTTSSMMGLRISILLSNGSE